MQSIPPRFRSLQPPNSHPHPSRPVHRPYLICRNFVYGGVCKEISCPRAHVPYHDMLDLLDYLITRRDFPSELRSARKQLRPPKLDLCRNSLPSDRICFAFIPLPCSFGTRCTRTHFSVDNIYRSLMWPVDRAQPHEAAVTPQLGSEVPLATPVDPTTRAIVPMPANDEQLVVKLPQGTGSESVPLDHDPPLDVVVRLPNDSPPESETTATESIDPEHLQSSPTGPSLDAVA
ncbi:hypothetical protein EDB92DRAFT_1838077, partial [Lactarius akahatsu]